MFPETRTARAFGRQCRSLGFDWQQAIGLLRRSEIPDRAEEGSFRAGYGIALHFVGFRGDEYCSAVRAFGPPDFVHRSNDLRLRFGGELAEGDIVLYANGSERRPSDFSFDDSAAFENLERS